MKTKRQILVMVSVCLILHLFYPIKFNLIIEENNKQQKEEGLPSSVKQSSQKQEVKSDNTSIVSEKSEEVIEQEVQPRISKLYRLTSFYSNDGYGTGSCTGSGLCEKDFQINNKGWYTYNGYLVLAGATEELLRSGYSVKGGNVRQEGKHYFRYYDTVKLEIDGIIYDGIIIDSCGSSMWYGETRLDLFVSNSSSVIDRGYRGKSMITVWY